MRVFLAIPIPIPFPIEQSEYSQLLFVKEFHITLAFFGEVTEDELLQIQKRLKRFSFTSFSLKTGSAFAYFPNSQNPKLVYIPVIHQKELKKLHSQIRTIFADMFSFSTFVPHITLARVQKGLSMQEKENLESQVLPIHSLRITEMLLQKSELSNQGSTYQIIQKIRLK